MISSMTGFGKGVLQLDHVIAEVEIKSLNSRYLDLMVKFPRSLSDKELAIREIVKNRIKRGKVSVNIYLKREGIDNRNVFIDQNALKETVKLLKEIKDTTELDTEINFDHILSFQHLFFTDTTGDSEKEYQLVLDALDKAIDQLEMMRKKEGAELEKDLRLRISNISNTIEEIEELSKSAVVDYFNKLKERAAQLVDELTDFDDRLKAELALLSEKYDITEEIVRLKSHCKVFLDTLKDNDEIGRKMNFLCQEMNREANTINSKSVSSEISYKGLFIKEELEKIREQIQNIE
ncbi:MAG: YicC/YloC family endoribonuclease [Rhodothermaceae bacterium]